MLKIKRISVFLILILLLSFISAAAADSKYRVVIDYKYDMLSYYNNNYVVEKSKKWGILDTAGKTVMNLQSYPIEYYSEGLIPIYENKRIGFMDITGRKVIAPKWDYLSFFSEGLAWVAQNKKFGYIDKKGNIVIKPQFDYAYDFVNGVAPVLMWNRASVKNIPDYGDMLAVSRMNGNGKWGLINKSGKVLIELKYDIVTAFSGNDKLFIVGSYSNGTTKYGVAGLTGKFTVTPSLDKVSYFPEGYNSSPVMKDNKWAFIDRSGKLATKFVFDYEPKILPGTSLWSVIKNDPEYGLVYGIIDDTGKTILEPEYTEPFEFYNGITKITKGAGGDTLNGYASSEGKVIIEPRWDKATNFSEGIAWVLGDGSEGKEADSQNSQEEYLEDNWEDFYKPGTDEYESTRYCWRPIDKTGQYLSTTGWDKVTDFKNSFAAVSDDDGKSTIINRDFDKICELKYNIAACLSGDRYVFIKNNKYGIVDKSGKIILNPEFASFESPSYFPEDIQAMLTKSSWSTGSQYGYIGKSGKIIGGTYWDNNIDTYYIHDNLFPVQQKGKYGFLNLSAETVAITPVFDRVEYLRTDKGESVWKVQKGGKYGVIAIKIP